MGRLALLLTGLLLVSCASGDEEMEDENIFPDASTRPIIDANTRIDARPQTLPDSGFGEGLVCMSHNDCGVMPGTCCVGLIPGVNDTGFCLPGEIVVGDICNPF